MKLAHAVGMFAVATTACAPCLELSPNAPSWRTDDRKPFLPRPEEAFSGILWDGADQMFFRPIATTLTFPVEREAANVNAVDEVPSSSWFENRIGLHGVSPADAARGPCTGELPDHASWLVLAGKPDGANPGFIAKAPDGKRYLLKFDSMGHPRATAADAIVSRLYHAIGFHVPCNRIVHLAPRDVAIQHGANYKSDTGDKLPFTPRHLVEILEHAERRKDGLVRASASEFLDGTPLGPFRYEGVRPDDPNDTVPHEDRRELRAHRLLAAWVGHTDAREANTLDTWRGDSRGGSIEHHLLDFGDALGCVWDPPMLGRRVGRSAYFDAPDILLDWLSFGAISRPWETARFGPAGASLGYFDVLSFDPDTWEPGYGNPAMNRMTLRDGAWMARLIARIGSEHLRAIVAEGRVETPLWNREVVRILEGRRRRILERYLYAFSPVASPEVVDAPGSALDKMTLCVEVLGDEGALISGSLKEHAVVAHQAGAHGPLRLVTSEPRRAEDGRTCVTIGPTPSSSTTARVWLDWRILRPNTGSLRVHLAPHERDRPRIVAVERRSGLQSDWNREPFMCVNSAPP